MIRLARISDANDLAKFGKDFFQQSGMVGLVSYLPIYTADFVRRMVNSSKHLLLVVQFDGKIVGTIGFAITNFFFNNKQLHAQEMFFWIQPEYRGLVGSSMLATAEAHAKTRGCKTMSMVSLEASEPEKVGGFYMSKGYKKLETSFIKEL